MPLLDSEKSAAAPIQPNALLNFMSSGKSIIGALDAALKDLEALDPKQAQIVELRFFYRFNRPRNRFADANFSRHSEAGVVHR